MASDGVARAVKSSAPRTIVLGLALILAAHALSACVPLALTAAAVTAIDVSLDRRSAGRYLDDNTLELNLRSEIANDAALDGSNVSVTVVNGIVLLSGEINTDAQRQRAGERAKSFEKTRKVVNELALAGKTNITSRLNDAWITGKVKARLLNAPNLPASAVKVVTEHGRVYLLGLVTKIEAEAAVEAVRGVSGVTHIVTVFEYQEQSGQ